jgi:preprotein translocase subunit SecF
VQAGFKDPVVQFLGTQRDVLVRMPAQESSDLAAKVSKAVQLPNNTATVKKVDAVGSQMGTELYTNSLIAIVLSLALMLVYVAIRFQIKLAVGAVISLLHDTLFTIGIFSIFGWPFDLTVLAAVLALIGYSLNDTIVVFDRIRENFRKIRGAEPTEIVDISLTETLRRTFMTVTTVLLVVFAMFFLGGDGLYWFSVALLVGLFAGTYSSIYIATSYALMMGLNRQDFVVQVKPEFEEDQVVDAP